MAAPSSKAPKRLVYAVSFAATMMVGVWYGAGWKIQQDASNTRTAYVEASPAERIEQLEAFKGDLLKQKAELQLKINRLMAKPETNRPSPT